MTEPKIEIREDGYVNSNEVELKRLEYEDKQRERERERERELNHIQLLRDKIITFEQYKELITL